MLRKFLFIFLFVPFLLKGQKSKAILYIEKYKDLAIEEMKLNGVPASITLAQGMLESNYGESDLAKSSNNHFGIKCKKEWLGGKVYFDDDTLQECFRKYESVAESFRDHSLFLKTRSHYKFLFSLDQLDDSAWAYGLKQAKYATAPNYPQLLLNIIQKYDLHQYTLEGLKSQTKQLKQPENSIPSNPSNNNFTPIKNSAVSKYEYFQAIKINKKKAIYIPKGTALLKVADDHKIPYSRLIIYNDLGEIDFFPKDQIVFLEKKSKSNPEKIYIYDNQIDIYTISQEKGIKLQYLYKYNQHKDLQNLKIGDTIFLEKYNKKLWMKLQF